MKFEQTQKRLTTFTAISLTDIVLLLLIFFLLSSSFIVQPGIKVRLPKATTAEAEAGGKIFVTITRDGRLFLNQKRVRQADLGEKIRRLLQKNPDQAVVIQADKSLPLERAIEVIDIVKLAGGERFVIATQPE